MDGLWLRYWPQLSRAWADWDSPEDALYDELASVDTTNLHAHAETSVAVAWADQDRIPGWVDESN